MQSHSSTANEWALLGLIVLFVAGITFSPDAGRIHKWLYWFGAPLALTVALTYVSHDLTYGVTVGFMGLIILATIYGIRRLVVKLRGPVRPKTGKLLRAGPQLVITATSMALLATLSWNWYQAAKYGHALTGALGCLSLANLFAAVKTNDELREMNASADGQGITFTSPTLQRMLSATLLVLIGLTLAAWGYLQATGKLSWDHSSHYHGRRTRSSGGLLPLFILLLGAIGLILLPLGVLKIYNLKYPAFLRIDQSGIRSYQGARSNRFITWDDVDRIPPGTPVQNTSRYMPLASVYPRQGPTLTPPSSLGGSDNGFRLTNLMRFYWKNPQHRNELSTGYALERLTMGEFEPDVAFGDP